MQVRGQSGGGPAAAAIVAAVALVAGTGCSLIAPFSMDPLRGGAVDGGADVEPEAGDAGPDARDGGEADGDAGGREPGAMTLVLSSLWLETERRCDLDGDGTPDNAIAELGNPNSSIFATYLNGAIDRFFTDEFSRIVVHLPWVDDVTGPTDPATTLIFSMARPSDDVWDDDFDGGSSFVTRAGSLDPCGEPVHVFQEASLEAGALAARSGEMPLPMGSGMRPAAVAELTGSVGPLGREAELHACAYVTIRQFGELLAPSWFDAAREDLTMLEVILAGGAGLGVPVPGVEPDLDLDGDGLEQIDLDAESLIVRCVDGDRTVIDGRQCWTDDRIADGFALSISVSAVDGLLDGPEEHWRLWTQGSCLEHLDCAVGCKGRCLCEPICPEGEAASAELRACFEERCFDECFSDYVWTIYGGCYNCAWIACNAAVRACEETDCCVEPPEQSLWGPQ